MCVYWWGRLVLPCASRIERDLHDELPLRQQTPRRSVPANIGPLYLAEVVMKKVTWSLTAQI